MVKKKPDPASTPSMQSSKVLEENTLINRSFYGISVSNASAWYSNHET
jgi:hypothetical protein